MLCKVLLFVCCCLVFLDVFIDSLDVIILSSFQGEKAYIEKMSAHTTLQFSSHRQSPDSVETDFITVASDNSEAPPTEVSNHRHLSCPTVQKQGTTNLTS